MRLLPFRIGAGDLGPRRGMGCSVSVASISPLEQETESFPPPDDPRFDPSGKVPGVVDLGAKQAKDAIESQGYTIEVEVGPPARRETDSYRVSRQQPAAGSLLARGEVIKITIWDRWSAPQRRVPDVVGSSAADAKATLERQGFRASVEVGAPTDSQGEAYTVARQEPAPGAPAPAGAQVALRVHGPYLPRPKPPIRKPSRPMPPARPVADSNPLSNWTYEYLNPITKRWVKKSTFNLARTGQVRADTGDTIFTGRFDGKRFTGYWLSNASSHFYKCKVPREGYTGWGEFVWQVVDYVPEGHSDARPGTKFGEGYWNYCGLEGDLGRDRWWWGPYKDDPCQPGTIEGRLAGWPVVRKPNPWSAWATGGPQSAMRRARTCSTVQGRERFVGSITA